eukprot:1577468-Rhodomonas_salina.2
MSGTEVLYAATSISIAGTGFAAFLQDTWCPTYDTPRILLDPGSTFSLVSYQHPGTDATDHGTLRIS